MKVVALSGGVGGAKLARGLARVLVPGELTVVCNTADDFEHLGLPISPDLDSVLYAMAGIADEQRGWGRANETWSFMEATRLLGLPDWFQLGDRDLATHLLRRNALQAGARLSEVTAELVQRLGVTQRLLPMSNSPVRTRLETDGGMLAFQDYFVRLRAQPRVLRLHFDGASNAAPPVDVASLMPDLIIICPSNPYLSVDPILAIDGWRLWLQARACPCVAVSPIVAGDAIRGCAAKMMREFDIACDAVSIATHYGELIDGIVIDELDRALLPRIAALELAAVAAPTIMRNDADREDLAVATLRFGAGLTATMRRKLG